MNDFDNLYVGIVTNIEDPEKRGRVQVYISALGPSLSCERAGKGATYRTLADKDSITKNDLKQIDNEAIWCYTLSPIIGGGSIGRFNKETGKSTTSNSASNTDEFEISGQNHGALSMGSKFKGFGAAKDAFSDPSVHTMRNGNYHGTDYNVNCYVNAPNGLYSRPALNAKVLVGFVNGSKSNGIILGKVPWEIEYNLMGGE